MSPTDDADSRESGVEFGDLADELADHDYPATNEELVQAYGDYTLELAWGEQSLREVLRTYEDQTYESADEVRQSVLNAVERDAVGREGYSDRGQGESDSGADEKSL